MPEGLIGSSGRRHRFRVLTLPVNPSPGAEHAADGSAWVWLALIWKGSGARHRNCVQGKGMEFVFAQWFFFGSNFGRVRDLRFCQMVFFLALILGGSEP